MLNTLKAQLVGLRAAGVDIELGLPATEWDDEFRRIELALADAPPERDALPALSPPPPEPLAELLHGWFAGGDLAALLEARRRAIESDRACRTRIARGFTYPIAVAVIAILALGGVCTWLLPMFEAQIHDLRIEPTRSVAVLQWLAATLPVWIWLAPLGLIGFGVWITRRPRPRAASHRRMAEEARVLAAMPPQETAAHDRDADSAPLLDWARKQPNTDDRALELRAVGRLYDAMATRSESVSSRFAPLAATVLIGGGVCALYALAVFLPVIELLSVLPLYQ